MVGTSRAGFIEEFLETRDDGQLRNVWGGSGSDGSGLAALWWKRLE
jgi:hypothetical protein